MFSVQVENAIEYLKVIGALDENENLTVLGKTPVERFLDLLFRIFATALLSATPFLE